MENILLQLSVDGFDLFAVCARQFRRFESSRWKRNAVKRNFNIRRNRIGTAERDDRKSQERRMELRSARYSSERARAQFSYLRLDEIGDGKRVFRAVRADIKHRTDGIRCRDVRITSALRPTDRSWFERRLVRIEFHDVQSAAKRPAAIAYIGSDVEAIRAACTARRRLLRFRH